MEKGNLITLSLITKKIKEKKEFSGISNSLIDEELEKYLRKHKISLDRLTISDIKIISKEIRASLRYYTGQYQKSVKDRSKLLNEGNIEKLLQTHSSTAERISFYPVLKRRIEDLSVKSILDIGCGLNPLALANPKIKYFASDIKEDELNIISTFFKKNNIKGKTFVYDLRKSNISLPSIDLSLLLKVLDVALKNKHKTAEKLLLKLPSKYIIVSFSTRKLSGKPMNHPSRIWFERILSRINYPYEVFNSDNEIFYLIRKLELTKK
ncbi:MAG: hypothetical protein Q7S74_02255 [Nanoarchaeota archaeon]|nr:hypothetical protein [Nanoarchaeota archaeon]